MKFEAWKKMQESEKNDTVGCDLMKNALSFPLWKLND